MRDLRTAEQTTCSLAHSGVDHLKAISKSRTPSNCGELPGLDMSLVTSRAGCTSASSTTILLRAIRKVKIGSEIPASCQVTLLHVAGKTTYSLHTPAYVAVASVLGVPEKCESHIVLR